MSEELNQEVVASIPPVSTEIPPVASGQPGAGVIDQPPDPAALKAEIERLEAVKKKAQEDAAHWRQEKARARAEYFKPTREDEKPPTPPAVDLGIGLPPSQDDFNDYDKFNDAKIAYEIKKARATWEREEAIKQADTQRQQRVSGLQERINQGFEKYPDFEEVALDQTVPITPLIMEVLAETESPADIAYYLGKNRAEAIKIARMTPMAVARAIARIELEIKNAGPAPLIPKPNISGAPAPIRPVGSGNPVLEKDPNKMSQKEYEAWMNGRGAKRF